MAVEASIILDFESQSADDVSGTVLVELDDEHINNLDLEGELKGSFLPEDEPVFLIHHDTTIEVLDVRCTHGSVTHLPDGNLNRTRTLDGLFTAVDTEISIPYFGVTDVTEIWYGNIGDIYVDGMNLIASDGTFPCYCTAEYEVLFNQKWMLTPPPLDLIGDEDYTIYVVVYLREIVL